MRKVSRELLHASESELGTGEVVRVWYTSRSIGDIGLRYGCVSRSVCGHKSEMFGT